MKIGCVMQIELCYLDFSRAFDPVNHGLLLINFESFGIRGAEIHMIEGFSYQENILRQGRGRTFRHVSRHGRRSARVSSRATHVLALVSEVTKSKPSEP